MSKFLLLLGPSGVGKTSIIQELKKLDNKFVYISPYTTRPLREGENDKISVSEKVIREMENKGELLTINFLYGIYYATPKNPIIDSLSKGLYPVLDWPIDKFPLMLDYFPQKLFSVYISPPSLLILEKRLSKDGRDDGKRLESAKKELSSLEKNELSYNFDLFLFSEDGKIQELATLIYASYLKSLDSRISKI